MMISVLMSTYRKERADYLDEAMNSIWTDQMRKPDQIVLVEDGPLTPELYAVIDRWKAELGSVLTIVANKENKGLASALNDGVEIVTGDLVARMDSDDRSAPDRFFIQEMYMNNHPEVDILGGSIIEFNDEGTLHNMCSYPGSMQEVKRIMYRASPLAHPAVMFRRRVFDEGLRYSSKYHICEDVTLWYDAVAAHYVINNIQEVMLYFRRNDSVMRRRSREKAWNEFLAYNDGIAKVFGKYSYKYIYSYARLLFRLMPQFVIRRVYNSSLRKLIARGSPNNSCLQTGDGGGGEYDL